MRFEHLVEVNDLENPMTFILGREQIWAGLMARVENSVPFLPGLVECRILSREAGAVERLLVFGAAEVRDRASYAEAEWVCFETQRTAQHAGGRLTIRIEEPEEGRLF
ncbi:MAG TPA: AtaL-like protein, partial [Azospira sp.]|nr:AtaL-like protein [Azospira sp.]